MGYSSPEEMVATLTDVPNQVLVDPESRIEFVRGLKAGNLEDHEMELYRKDGTPIWLSVNARTVRDDTGKVLYDEGTCQDITPRKLAEEVVEQERRNVLEMKEQYQSSIDNMVTGFLRTDPVGRVVAANPAIARILGYSSPEEMVETITDIANQVFVSPATRSSFRQQVEEGFMEGHEVEVRRKDGTTRWLLANARALRGDSGEILYYEGTSHDITERKWAEEAAEQERQRIRAVVDTSPVGIIVVEGKDKIVRLCNEETERILGTSIKPGMSLDQLIPNRSWRKTDGTTYEMHERPLWRALVHGETARADEVLFESPDGRKVPLLYSAAPIYSDGSIIGAIGVIQDITPLQEIERLRAEFLGMVTHEFRTPLSAIKGVAATLQGSRNAPNSQETRDLLKIVDEQTDLLRDMVEDILDMTRYRGRLPLH